MDQTQKLDPETLASSKGSDRILRHRLLKSPARSTGTGRRNVLKTCARLSTVGSCQQSRSNLANSLAGCSAIFTDTGRLDACQDRVGLCKSYLCGGRKTPTRSERICACNHMPRVTQRMPQLCTHFTCIHTRQIPSACATAS